MKKVIPVLKSLWFLAVVFLVILGSGLPFPVHCGLILLTLLAPLLREFLIRTDLDERQIQIGHYSSHVAYFVYSVLLFLIILRETVKLQPMTLLIFYVLFVVPLVFKILISLLQRYGTVQGWSGYLGVFFRGIFPPVKVDERQNAIGNFSSHVAFYVFLTVTISVMLYQFVRIGQEPPTLWYMLLIVPMLSKFIVSFFMSYGAVRGAQFIGLTIVFIILIFILLSHGLSLVTGVEAIPFIVIFVLIGLAQKFPRVAGILLSVLALGLGLFFYLRVWYRMDIYLCILMFSLIPIPVFFSGMALLLHRRLKI
jgi:hypothetical protein